MLKISIVDGHHHVQTYTTKNGIRYYQEAYVYLGGAFPQQITVPLKNPADAKAIGDYSLDISNFQVGKYKNLELNPFELALIPANNKSAAKVA